MNYTIVIILIVVAVAVGYGLGLLDARITASLRKKKDEETGSIPVETQAEPEGKNRLGEHTVLKVTIDPAIKYFLELDGIRLDGPDEISPDQRQRLINLIVQIKPWLEGKGSQPGVAITAPTVSVPESIPVVLASPLVVPSTQKLPSNTSGQVRINPMRGLQSLLQNDIKAPGKEKGLSIVAMIDDVLQAKLQTSTLVNKPIHLEEGPMGEVAVVVGISRYNGVDEVPDVEIRAIIKEAISEWGKK